MYFKGPGPCRIAFERVETWDAIRSRRDVRQFEDRAIPAEHLDRILAAGRRSPSAGNGQPWDFVAVTERELLVELAGVWRFGHIADSAATVAIVMPRLEEPSRRELQMFDVGQAVMSMMLAGADLGIGSGHSVVEDEQLARSLLGYPADRYCAHLVPLGYPAGRPLFPLRRPNRRPFADVVHRNRW
jgi:nitroreductase